MIAFLQNCCLSAGNISADPTLAGLTTGLRMATVVLLAVPWTLVAVIGWWWWRSHRRLVDSGTP